MLATYVAAALAFWAHPPATEYNYPTGKPKCGTPVVRKITWDKAAYYLGRDAHGTGAFSYEGYCKVYVTPQFATYTAPQKCRVITHELYHVIFGDVNHENVDYFPEDPTHLDIRATWLSWIETAEQPYCDNLARYRWRFALIR